ncbi:MAG TPA: hypothetical protein VMS17_13220 [Gemmataceae bacterium]|nr:hypothetical protein [Gemmataceae bacterium]
MNISFRCSGCGRSLSVSPGFAGRRAKCPCGHELVVPAGQSAPSASQAGLKLPPTPAGEAPAPWMVSAAARPSTVPKAAMPPRASPRLIRWPWVAGAAGAALAAVLLIIFVVLCFRRPAAQGDSPPAQLASAPPATPNVPVSGPASAGSQPTPPAKPPAAPPAKPPAEPPMPPPDHPAPMPPAPDKPPAPPLEPDRPAGAIRAFNGHTAGILSVAFTADGRRIVSSSLDGTIRTWNTETGEEINRIDIGSSVHEAAFSSDGRRAAVWRLLGSPPVFEGMLPTFTDEVHVWDLDNGKEVASLKCGVVGGVAISLDGKRVLVNTPALRFNPDGGLTMPGAAGLSLFDAEKGEKLGAGKNASAARVVLGPDGRQALLCGDAKEPAVTLCDVETDQVLRRFKGSAGTTIVGMAFSPDGGRIAAGDAANGLHVWNAKSGDEIQSLQGHTGRVFALAFSADGRRLLSTGAGKVEGDFQNFQIVPTDCTVRLWDVDGGKELYCFKEHTAPVYAVAISPGGRRAVSGDGDGVVRLWALPK